MWESEHLTEKKLNVEAHRIIAETQLNKSKTFLKKYGDDINKQTNKFLNINKIDYKPISLELEASESIPVLNLVHSDNKILSKILGSLASICDEITLLVKEAQILYKDFILYEEERSNNIENLEHVSQIIDSLQKAYNFVERSQQVLCLLLKQLSCVLGRGYYTSLTTSSFTEMLHKFSQLLVALVTIEALLENPLLQEHLILYKKCIRNIMHSSKHNISTDNIKLFGKIIIKLLNELLSGRIFKDTLDKFLEDKLIASLKSCSLNSELTAYLQSLIYDLERDEDYINMIQLWLQLNVTTVFTLYIFGHVDKKMIKRIFDINKKISACNLVGNIMWYPEAFFYKHVQLDKLMDKKTIEQQRISLINHKYQVLPKETQMILIQGCSVLIDIEKLTKKNRVKTSELQEICYLLMDILKFIYKVNTQIKLLINIHTERSITMTKSVLSALCKLLELLKAVQLALIRNFDTLSNIIENLTQYLIYKALTILSSIKKNFTQEKSYKEHHLDVLSSLSVCEHALKGPNTSQRCIVANLALSASGLSSDMLSSLRFAINQLELISHFSRLININCDSSFLYWHQLYLLPVYYSKLVSTRSNLSRYYLILSALSDCSTIVEKNKLKEKCDSEMKLNVSAPLSQLVETNLRLQTHMHLELPPFDPIQNYFPLNFEKFNAARICDHYKNIKNDTEHYLSGIFYNLTTVVLYNWKTYGEMRRLALLQYGIDTVDDNLPMQTLEQGLDVLEIMRNINVFVGKYLYNLNSQVFIEESSNNKHFNSINISHVANSIRTHGLGIMNTTVNFTYQYLISQFNIFSQFMFDEHIKSKLLKDLRFFAEHKNELNQMYPYERAEKFNLGIRKLGLNQYGQSYLDLFRKVITHIGNAMGYVRLIKSGGRRCLADGACFIPDLKGIDDLKTDFEESLLPNLTSIAANGVQHDLENFIDNFEEATEYFNLLVKVFVPVLQNEDNIHLKNFYLIVPPLTINFIEHSLRNKDRLNKKNKADCAFTDDGFALGLAYIIELLDQASHLKSLHWFHSVSRKFKNDQTKIIEQKLGSVNDNTKLKQTLSLTEKRICTYEKEFQLLYYNFSSACLFFQV